MSAIQIVYFNPIHPGLVVSRNNYEFCVIDLMRIIRLFFVTQETVRRERVFQYPLWRVTMVTTALNCLQSCENNRLYDHSNY